MGVAARSSRFELGEAKHGVFLVAAMGGSILRGAPVVKNVVCFEEKEFFWAWGPPQIDGLSQENHYEAGGGGVLEIAKISINLMKYNSEFLVFHMKKIELKCPWKTLGLAVEGQRGPRTPRGQLNSAPRTRIWRGLDYWKFSNINI